MVESTENKVVYEIGTEKVFPFSLSFFEVSDIHCYLKSGDLSRELVSGEFTVEPKDDYRGGANITLEIDAEPGSVLTIVREIPIVQGLSLPENGRLPSEPMENQFDRIIMICQQLKEELGRSLVSEHGYEITVSAFLDMLSNSVNIAKNSEQSAKASANDAAEYSDAAKQSANNAKSSEQSAKASAGEAANAAAKELAKYLPLAGGEMTGVIYVPENGGFRTKHGKDVFLLAGSQWEGSARVVLRGQESEIDPGGVAITASGRDGDKALTLYTDGRIRFNGKDVECVTSWHSGNKWYRKYADGLIIQGGTANGPAVGNDGYDQKVNLSTPFTGTEYQVLLTYCGNKTSFDNYAHYYHIQTWSQTTTYFYHYAQEGLNCHWVAIGY